MRGGLALALAIGALQAAPASRPDGLVRIDAIVTDARGHLVSDLKAEDFSVVEDGAAEPVETVTWVAVASNGTSDPGGAIVPVSSREDEKSEAGRDGARVFAIFLDEYHVAKGPAADRARDLLAGFIEHDLGPRDLVIVVKPLDSLVNLRLTHDRDAAAAAVRAFDADKGDYAPRNAFERGYIAGTPARVEAVRSQIAMSALNALATHLGGLGSGRKTVIVLSEGFTRPRRRDSALPSIESVTRAANRGSVAIYSIDPRALASSADAPPDADHAATSADGGSDDRDVLRTFADETDGRAILTPGDVAAGLPRLAGDASAYYVLAFRPAHPNEVTKFHPVELHVKRPNVTVKGRKGYWSASADDLWHAMMAVAERPPKPPEPIRHASPLIRTWFGFARAPNGEMQVAFVWEPVPPVPGERARAAMPVVASVKATKPGDQSVVFEGEVRPSNSTLSGDAPAEAVFDAAPGRLLVQISIEDADARLLDTDVRDVVVGGLAGPIEIGTAQILPTRNAREFRELDADKEAVPTAAREFSRSERLLIRVPVYGTDASLSVTARLSSKLGKAMRELPIASVPGTAFYQVDLPLAGLAAGNYAVELAAKSAQGDARDVVNFRVTP